MVEAAPLSPHTVYAAHERGRIERPGIFHLLFWDGGRAAWPAKDFPTSRAYLGVDVAFMRSSWAEPKAFWVAFKGGDNKANHAHLDLGTFSFDALGEVTAFTPPFGEPTRESAK